MPPRVYLCSMKHPLLLCLETSSPICSVALVRGEWIDEHTSTEPNGHSGLLAVMVDDIMRRNDFSFDKLDAIVVNAGPGSYTGLRIGMSTAKGLCYALEKPLIAISALESMTHAFLKTHTPSAADLLFPMIDARRMEVYTQAFNAKGKPLAEQKAYISGEEKLFPSEPQGKVWLFGSGAEKMLSGLSHANSEAIPDSFISAAGLAEIATQRYISNQFDDVAYTTPNYGKAWQKG